MVKYNKKEKLCKSKRIDKVKLDFTKWMEKVDRYVYKNLNLHLSDLPDEDFWVNWDNNMEYKTMANMIIKDQVDFIDFMTK
jgi:hypothetical protein